MEEVWKDVEGYEGLYQVSNLGSVMSLDYRRSGYARRLTPKCNNKGYLWVELANGGVKRPLLIHRLVAIAFIANPYGLPQINHKDENTKNNNVLNLEWCDALYNNRYSISRHPERYSLRRVGRSGSSLLNLGVNQYSKDGCFIKRWDNSRTVFNETGMSDWAVSECCRGNRRTAYGFIWQYAN